MKTFIALLLLAFSFTATAQKTNEKLQQMLQEMVQGYHGDIGVYVQDLKHNRIAAINADTIFPTASIVKVPILIGIMRKIEQGALQYHQNLMFTDSLRYDEGDDLFAHLKDSTTVELGKVMLFMISFSDNCASLWLQSLAGTGTTINHILDSLGFKATRVNSRTPGRQGNRTQYGWGQTTPREMATIMQMIVKKQMLSPASSETMLRILGRQFWDEKAISQVPPDVFMADKTGAVDASRCEIQFVNSTNNTYILSIFTKNNQDTSWGYNNEAAVLTRKISAMLWKYFNPKSTFKGAPFTEESK